MEFEAIKFGLVEIDSIKDTTLKNIENLEDDIKSNNVMNGCHVLCLCVTSL